jgi:hypothetical protein
VNKESRSKDVSLLQYQVHQWTLTILPYNWYCGIILWKLSSQSMKTTTHFHPLTCNAEQLTKTLRSSPLKIKITRKNLSRQLCVKGFKSGVKGLTLSNPIFLPSAYSPALIYFGRERGWWITCNYPTVLKEKNTSRNRRSTTCAICWLKSVGNRKIIMSDEVRHRIERG